MRWTHTPLPAAEVEALSKRAGVSRVLAELLLRAGLTDSDTAAEFLQPALAALNDPFLLRNLEAAATRLRQAIAQREQVVVLGDYDVDGVSSTALLVMMLRRFGLNQAKRKRLVEAGADLIISDYSQLDRLLSILFPAFPSTTPSR